MENILISTIKEGTRRVEKKHHFRKPAPNFNCVKASWNNVRFNSPMDHLMFSFLHHMLIISFAQCHVHIRILHQQEFVPYGVGRKCIITLQSRSKTDKDIARMFSYTSSVYVERTNGSSKFGMCAAPPHIVFIVR